MRYDIASICSIETAQMFSEKCGVALEVNDGRFITPKVDKRRLYNKMLIKLNEIYGK